MTLPKERRTKKRMKYTMETTFKRYNTGTEMPVIAFWGHTDDSKKTTKACFSQWYACRFEVDGVWYHTAEQYMMAQKASLFGDAATQEKIMAADNPKDYKALGRLVQHFDAAKWDAAKYDIVLRGNLAKFSQNPELFAFLDGTGDSVLVEGSPYDSIWGVKLNLDDPAILDPHNWRGENLLGFALMEARDLLRERFANQAER